MPGVWIAARGRPHIITATTAPAEPKNDAIPAATRASAPVSESWSASTDLSSCRVGLSGLRMRPLPSPPSDSVVANIISVAPIATSPKSAGTSIRASTMLPPKPTSRLTAPQAPMKKTPLVTRRLSSCLGRRSSGGPAGGVEAIHLTIGLPPEARFRGSVRVA